jgi:cytochrome c biogenesis protein CcmG/thiol:disulfide interchange protein DsbE
VLLASALASSGQASLGGQASFGPAPDFHLTALDGTPRTLADFAGKIVVVNVWTSACEWCREETRALNAVAASEAAHGDVAFVGVDPVNPGPTVRVFAALHDVPYLETTGDPAFEAAYGVVDEPTTFVIGSDGMLRSRFAGAPSRATLTLMIDAARAGRPAILSSAAQQRANARFDPALFSLHGGIGTVRAGAHDALSATDNLNGLLGENVDGYELRFRAATLLDAAVSAFAPLATTDADRLLLLELRASAALDRGDAATAIPLFERAAQAAPDDELAHIRLGNAYLGTRDFARAADTYATAFEDDPSVEGLLAIAICDERAGRQNDAAIAFSRAIGMARSQVKEHPTDRHQQRLLITAYLAEGRAFAHAERADRAGAAFVQAATLAAQLPPLDSDYATDVEQAQEGLVALDLAAGTTALSLAPWTGRELSVALVSAWRAVVYRLVVSGSPGKAIALRASGVPNGWGAFFCAGLACPSDHTDLVLPASGIAVIELRIGRPTQTSAHPTIVVDGDGARASVVVNAPPR